jgi:hypothetical protein
LNLYTPPVSAEENPRNEQNKDYRQASQTKLAIYLTDIAEDFTLKVED